MIKKALLFFLFLLLALNFQLANFKVTNLNAADAITLTSSYSQDYEANIFQLDDDTVIKPEIFTLTIKSTGKTYFLTEVKIYPKDVSSFNSNDFTISSKIKSSDGTYNESLSKTYIYHSTTSNLDTANKGVFYFSPESSVLTNIENKDLIEGKTIVYTLTYKGKQYEFEMDIPTGFFKEVEPVSQVDTSGFPTITWTDNNSESIVVYKSYLYKYNNDNTSEALYAYRVKNSNSLTFPSVSSGNYYIKLFNGIDYRDASNNTINNFFSAGYIKYDIEYTNAFSGKYLSAQKYQEGGTVVDPSNNSVEITGSSSIYLQPSLQVDTEDVGENATLVMYIYLKSSGTGIMLPTYSTTLESVQQFKNLSKALDFSNSSGLTFDIYYGYRLNGVLKYNAYEVKVK